MRITPDIALELLRKAREKGATGGDILIVEGKSSSVHVRLGSIDRIKDSSYKILGLRLFSGKRCAITSTTDLSLQSIEKLIDDTCSLSRLTAFDEHAGLPCPLPDLQTKDVTLYDEAVLNISHKEMVKIAREAEESAFNYDSRITNSEGSSFLKKSIAITYANTNNFAGTYRTSLFHISVMPIAVMNGLMQRDHWYSTKRRFDRLEDPGHIGEEAARRTIRRLGARKIQTSQKPVVFDPETASTLLSHLSIALSGYSIYKKSSFLTDMLDRQIAPHWVTIYDDGTIPWGLGTRPFDSEGIPSRKTTLVDKGVLASYLLDTYSARKLNLKTTGNSLRNPGEPSIAGPTNLYLSPGPYTPEEIISSVESGLYVTELIGFGFNPVTGDYSRGAVGIWIENGELTYPVEEITIAGNMKDMLMQIEMVGNDLELRDKISSPTIKIGKLTIAGH